MIHIIAEMREKELKISNDEKNLFCFSIYFANDRKRIRIQYHHCIGSEVAGDCEDCEANTRVT